MHPVLHPPAPTLSGAPGLPSSLQPLGTLWDTRALMGVGCPENPGEAEHVPQGAAAPGPCSGPMVWWWMVWGMGMMVVDCGGWCRGDSVEV